MTDNMIEPQQTVPTPEMTESSRPVEISRGSKRGLVLLRVFFAILIFGFGLGGGYIIWGQNTPVQKASNDMDKMVNAINPKEGFIILAKYNDIGPKLIAIGAIDLDPFKQLYQQSSQPLSEQEIKILTKGSQDQVVITRQNAYFLLNYFWALGLTNKNPVLDNGPIQQGGKGQIDSFASTGGWTIGKKPVMELFSSTPILELSADQQAMMEEVAQAVYRPCCNNPTRFPDCNHGMAMLGLLELMASQNATSKEMFQAAKSVNAFWFPQQTLEQAIFIKYIQKMDYVNIDAKIIVGQQYSSGTGFQQMHQWLSNNGLLEQAPKSGNNCGV
jgi:hypothetical protein